MRLLRLHPRRRAVVVRALATLVLCVSPVQHLLAQQAVPAPPGTGTGTAATVAGTTTAASALPVSSLSLHDLPLGTRVRLQTMGLPAFAGLATGAGVVDRSSVRTLVGALVQIDSVPTLSYLVQTAQGTWAVPRGAITAASRHAGTSSAGAGVRRSALTGALLGTAAAVLYAQALGGTDKAYGTRIPIAASSGAAIGMLFWRGAAREQWAAVTLPPPPLPPEAARRTP